MYLPSKPTISTPENTVKLATTNIAPSQKPKAGAMDSPMLPEVSLRVLDFLLTLFSPFSILRSYRRR
jgi:hypothetical protein